MRSKKPNPSFVQAAYFTAHSRALTHSLRRLLGEDPDARQKKMGRGPPRDYLILVRECRAKQKTLVPGLGLRP